MQRLPNMMYILCTHVIISVSESRLPLRALLALFIWAAVAPVAPASVLGEAKEKADLFALAYKGSKIGLSQWGAPEAAHQWRRG